MTTATEPATATAPIAPAGDAATLYRQVASVLISAGTPRQTVERALRALADGAAVASGIPGVYYIASSDGSATYITGAMFCSCPATTGHCYHRIMVIIIAAAGHRP